MHKIWILMKRELLSYFMGPIAYIFIIIFLLLSGICTFYFGNFIERGQADLYPFFSFHPWLYMVFIPAITMRLWAEERKSGTIELLLTLPITSWDAVLAKFLAAWLFICIALCLTFPLWLSVNYLGKPDNGIILAAYIGSVLMAGGFTAMGACISAITKNQVVAFILSLLICLLFNLAGFPAVLDYCYAWLPSIITDTIASFSFITNFNSISKGIIELRSIIYFSSFIIFWLFANRVLIELKKAD